MVARRSLKAFVVVQIHHPQPLVARLMIGVEDADTTMNNDTSTTMPHSIFSYVHHNRQTASIVKLQCKTDFALRTDLVTDLGHKLAMQTVAVGRLDATDSWIFDSTKKVSDIINAAREKLGEPLIVSNVHLQS